MGELTKTLELKLADPNLHKRQKLRETRDAYQQALQAAFDAGCNTQSAANDVVVEYDLSGYAKNALKKYVPPFNSEGVPPFTAGGNRVTERHKPPFDSRSTPKRL